MLPGSEQRDVTPSSRWSFSSFRNAFLPSPLSAIKVASRCQEDPCQPLSPESVTMAGSVGSVGVGGSTLEWPSTPPLAPDQTLPQNSSFTSAACLYSEDLHQRSQQHFMTRTATADDMYSAVTSPHAPTVGAEGIESKPLAFGTAAQIQPLQARSFSAPSIVDLLKYAVPYELAEFGSPHHHRGGRGPKQV